MASSVVKDFDGTPITVNVGDWISFKNDVEQSGKVVKIVGKVLYLENVNGFDGDYIGGCTEYAVHVRDCWIE